MERRERILSKDSDALIAVDLVVKKAIIALDAALDKRDETIQRIAEVGLFPVSTISALENRTTIDAALVGGLGQHFPTYIDPAQPHALNDMVAHDCKLLNRPSVVPQRELTPVERELQRQARRTSDGYPVRMSG